MSIQRVDGVSSSGTPYHWYRLDGRRADGVTTILGKGLPKPWLAKWAAKSVAEHVADNLDTVAGMAGRDAIVAELKEIPWAARDAAANRGTEVHALAEQLVHGAEVEVPEPLAGHVDAYVRFLDDWQPKPVLVEAVVANRRWNLAGTLDLVADLPDGQRALIDLKTSRAIYPEVALQLAAYRYAEVYLDADGHEQSMPDLGINACYAVHLRADGYDVIPVEAGEVQWKVAQHAIWLVRHTGDLMKTWIGEPAPVPLPSPNGDTV